MFNFLHFLSSLKTISNLAKIVVFLKNWRGHQGQESQLHEHPAVEGAEGAQLRGPGGPFRRYHDERHQGTQQDGPGGVGPAQRGDWQPIQVKAEDQSTIASFHYRIIPNFLTNRTADILNSSIEFCSVFESVLISIRIRIQHFMSIWIRIRVRIQNPDPDPDPY